MPRKIPPRINQPSRNPSFNIPMPRTLATILALFMLAACAGVPDQPPAPDIDALLVEVGEHMYTLISQERTTLSAAASPLRRAPLLVAAAQAHAEAMAEQGGFDEGGADQNVAVQRLAADAEFQGFVGENSAMQYFYPEFGFDPEAFAHGFIDQWLQSEGHRANIEYLNFTLTGIGLAANGNEIYAAGLFATEIERPAPAQ